MGQKRIHTPTAKPGEVLVAWGRPEPGEPPEVVVAWGAGGACRADGRIVLKALQGTDIFEGRDLVSELEQRGYDITTLKFSIRRKAQEQGPA